MNGFKHGLSILVMMTTVMATTVACAGQRTAGEATNDAAITAKVKTKLLADTRTDGLKIDVDTQSGIVYLSGEVENPDERQLAESLAKTVNGVASVENNLRVKQMTN
jgi:osmotically-inducible protein OsmY